MDLKYWALIALLGGGAAVLAGCITEGTGPMSRDPLTMYLVGGGALSTGAGITYLLYRGFMAL